MNQNTLPKSRFPDQYQQNSEPTTAVPAREIPNATNNLEKSISRLREIVAQITDRINSARNTKNVSKPEPSDPEEVLCPVASNLRTLRQQIDCESDQLQQILNDLEL